MWCLDTLPVPIISPNHSTAAAMRRSTSGQSREKQWMYGAIGVGVIRRTLKWNYAPSIVLNLDMIHPSAARRRFFPTQWFCHFLCQLTCRTLCIRFAKRLRRLVGPRDAAMYPRSSRLSVCGGGRGGTNMCEGITFSGRRSASYAHLSANKSNPYNNANFKASKLQVPSL